MTKMDNSPEDASVTNDKQTGIAAYIPILQWLRHYEPAWLTSDFIAGISVWALLVPESIAYASVAGMPAQYGLYAALGGVTAYAVFGTSRQVNTGPSAIVAVISASIIASLATSGSPQWLTYTAALALISGIIFATFGILRMGWISYFLSRAVLGGFVFGFGIALIINQSFKIFGVPEAGGTYFLRFIGMIKAIPNANPYTLAVGATSIVLLLIMRRYLPKWPRALITVALSIIAAPALDLTAHGVKVVGTLPTGLPVLGLPNITLSTLGTLVLGGLAVFFVGLSESLAAAREMSEKHDYSINASQEMIAQGAANAASGFFGGFVVGGSLSKTTVADNAGQKTQLGSLLTGAFILLTILFLASVFRNLPEAVLGAVVIDAAIGLVNIKEFRRFRSTSCADFATYLAAMLGLLFIGVLAGIVIGAILSIILLVSAASRSPVRRMAFDEKDQLFVDAGRHPEAKIMPGILVVEIDGPLFYANASSFRDSLLRMVEKDSPSSIAIDLGPVTIMDLDGADIITKISTGLAGKGIKVALARVDSAELDLFRRAGTLSTIGEQNTFDTVRKAVAELEK